MWNYSNVAPHSFTDLQVADRSAPRTCLNCAERLVRVNNSTASQPLNHNVGLREHATRHVTSPSGPHVRRRLMVGRKPRTDWNTHDDTVLTRIQKSLAASREDAQLHRLKKNTEKFTRQSENGYSTHTHHNHFTALFPGPPEWAGARRELLDFMVYGKINRGRHTNHPAGRHSIQTNQCSPPSSPSRFQSISQSINQSILIWGLKLHTSVAQ